MNSLNPTVKALLDTIQSGKVVKRMNQIILERARCLLSNARLPHVFWAEVGNAAAIL